MKRPLSRPSPASGRTHGLSRHPRGGPLAAAPPLPFVSRLAYRFLFQAALVTLPPQHRRMIGVRAWPRRLVVQPNRIFLRALRWLIGPEDPLQDATRERIRRSESANSSDATCPA